MAKVKKIYESVKPDSNLFKQLYYGETVKECIGYKNYFVTNTGRIFSAKKIIIWTTIEGKEYQSIAWKELKCRIIRGYKALNITNSNGIRETVYLHNLVKETFDNAKVDKTVLKIVFIDKNKLNCNYSNLALAFRNKKDYQAHKNYAYKIKMQELL